MKESLKIATTDGFVLAATRFIPEKPNGKVVLMNAATGVKQRYYHDFAGFLAEEGFVVYTYDYRGVGESRPKTLRGFRASMADWGTIDFHSMLLNVFQTHQQSEVILIGHSVGGQFAGFSPLTSKVDSVVMIGSQTPFWKNYQGLRLSIKLWWFWYVMIPFFTRMAGYFPASRLRLFEDLPAEVALQWARWARTPDYCFNEFPELQQCFASLQQSALMISFSDDDIAPPAAVKDLMQRYRHLKWDHWQLTPGNLHQKHIGHFGFFKKRMELTLWKETVKWINESFASGEHPVA